LLGVPPGGSPIAELWTAAHSAVGCGSPIAAMFAGGCRAEWDCQARECGDDAVGHTGGVSPFAVEALTEGVRAVTRDPVRAAMFCDIGGTLDPVVDRADDAQAPGAVSRLLGALGRRYACDTLGPRLTAASGYGEAPYAGSPPPATRGSCGCCEYGSGIRADRGLPLAWRAR
jgi:hypothetical protein